MSDYKYVCMDCGNIHKPNTCDLCDCGADNFLEVGDPIILPNGLRTNIERIIKSCNPILPLGDCFSYSIEEIVFDAERFNP